MRNFTGKLDDFHFAITFPHPLCWPIISIFPGTLMFIIRLLQIICSFIAIMMFGIGSACSDKSRNLLDKSVDCFRNGAMFASIAFIQIIPGGGLLVRFCCGLVGAALKW